MPKPLFLLLLLLPLLAAHSSPEVPDAAAAAGKGSDQVAGARMVPMAMAPAGAGFSGVVLNKTPHLASPHPSDGERRCRRTLPNLCRFRARGRHELRKLDPFLLLDEFSVTKPACFPDHPHRGFETITYMLDVHKIVDLSTQLDREAMWYMEVAEAYNFFYKADASGFGSPS
ncbi:pirin-like protein [Hordeum vulgare]|nr:pirin-like protein [Hordeum vulgare]